MKLYRILEDGEIIESKVKGKYAGNKNLKVFGTLGCKSGKIKLKKENRVFFHIMKNAILEGYRPCKVCRPMDEKDFDKYKEIIPYKTLDEFYNKDD
jgi:methylphosphotriester-DNA--protein-cysteine methyltransferase